MTPATEHPVLVLGTHNLKKRQELVELLEPHGLQVQTLEDFPAALEVVEDGNTFEENARKKASEQAKHLNRWVLGEDSGLVVPALDGAPGVFSARYSGPGATDQTNNAKLLAEMEGKTESRRNAYYVSFVALADPTGEVLATSEGRCQGRLRTEPAGSGGFGYDPLFEIREYHRTFGELSPVVKHALSHRGRALAQISSQIVKLLRPNQDIS